MRFSTRKGPQKRPAIALRSSTSAAEDCRGPTGLAMTTICHREPRRGVAIPVHGDCFGGYRPPRNDRKGLRPMQRPTGWTFLLVSLVIPYSSMRSGTPTVMNPKLRDCFYDAERREFVTIFGDGKLYRARRNWLQEDDGSEILRVHVESDGSAFRVEQASEHRFEVPWDFVLYHSEPRYA